MRRLAHDPVKEGIGAPIEAKPGLEVPGRPQQIDKGACRGGERPAALGGPKTPDRRD